MCFVLLSFFENLPKNINFVGNVEGRECFTGDIDCKK